MSASAAGTRVVACPTCGVSLSIPPEVSGPVVACPVCRTMVGVPGESSAGEAEERPLFVAGGGAPSLGAKATRKAMRYESMALCGLLVVAATSIAAYALHLANAPAPPAAAPTTADSTVAEPKTSGSKLLPGGEAVVGAIGRSEVFLAKDESDWDEVRSLGRKGDKAEMARLITTGRAVSLPNGAKVTVVSLGDDRVRIRVTDGDFAGAEGWADATEVRPVRPTDIAKRSPRQPAPKSAEPSRAGLPASVPTIVQEPETPANTPVDPVSGFEDGAAFDNPTSGRRSGGVRGGFENPTHATARPAHGPGSFENPPSAHSGSRMAPNASAPNVPDPSFENDTPPEPSKASRPAPKKKAR